MSAAFPAASSRPSLAVGAGLGHTIAQVLPQAPAGAVVLLGMVAYFSGVVQAPITAVIIVMEMTDDQRVTVPLMATAMLAFGRLTAGVPPAALCDAGEAVPAAYGELGFT